MSLVKHILENDYNEKLHKNINPIINENQLTVYKIIMSEKQFNELIKFSKRYIK